MFGCYHSFERWKKKRRNSDPVLCGTKRWWSKISPKDGTVIAGCVLDSVLNTMNIHQNQRLLRTAGYEYMEELQELRKEYKLWELLYEALRGVRYAESNNCTVKQAIYKIRTDSNMQKRYDGFHFLSSRTVLSKGLEFECIIIDMIDPLKMKDNGYHSISFLLISSGIWYWRKALCFYGIGDEGSRAWIRSI